jgi:hypothetical protein
LVAVRAGVSLRAKVVKFRQPALSTHFENRTHSNTKVAHSAGYGCAVEVPVDALNQRISRAIAVGLVEIHQVGEGLRGRGNRRDGTK